MVSLYERNMSVRKLTVALVAALLAVLAAAPALVQAGLFKISKSREISIGRDFYRSYRKEHKYLDNTPEGARVKMIGQRLVQRGGLTDYTYTFTLVDDKEVNAFAVPGGYIFINKGLYDYIAYDEAMLAAVLAHEIGHVHERHYKKMYEDALKAQLGILAVGIALGGRRGQQAMNVLSTAGNLVFLKYSRDDEEHADWWGVRLAYLAGYDPYGMSRSMKLFMKIEGKLGQLELFDLLRTHPDPESRMERTKKLARDFSGHEQIFYHPPQPPSDNPLHEKKVRIIKLD